MTLDPRTPVLVGLGVSTQREERWVFPRAHAELNAMTPAYAAPDGARVVAFSDDPAIAARLAVSEMCGPGVQVHGFELRL